MLLNTSVQKDRIKCLGARNQMLKKFVLSTFCVQYFCPHAQPLVEKKLLLLPPLTVFLHILTLADIIVYGNPLRYLGIHGGGVVQIFAAYCAGIGQIFTELRSFWTLLLQQSFCCSCCFSDVK